MKKSTFLGLMLTAILLAIVIGLTKTNTPFSASSSTGGKHIALIRVEGTISGGSQDAVFGGVASAEDIMQNLRDAADDPQTAAILIRINSPGGSAPAAQEIGEEVKRIRNAKHIPVIASMGDVAASGGYWIACTTDKIIANPSTMTGSIGVIMQTQSWKELYNKIGVKNNSIKSGPHKDMGSTARDLTPSEQEILQKMVDDIYDQFVDIVSEGRHLDKQTVARWPTGGFLPAGRQKNSN